MTIETITDHEIVEARKVLEDHIVNPVTKEGAFECLLWCIASQALGWEPASNFVYELRRTSHPQDVQAANKHSTLQVLTDKEAVFQASLRARLRFAYARRFDSSIDFLSGLEGDWPDTIIEATQETREEYVKKIKWVAEKTFSFWHICLGGTNLLALDVHVMRGLHTMGIQLNTDYINSVQRATDSQRVRRTPNKKDYNRIEDEARWFFLTDHRFLLENEQVDMALIDGVLWWKGANRELLGQYHLFGAAGSWKMPYAKLH